jgi:putative transposase
MLARKKLDAGRDLVRRLMDEMGIEALYQKPRKDLSAASPEHRVWPYLLRGVAIIRVLQVWATDITYIHTAQGDAYLCAVLDWFSRKVLSWRLSKTLEAGFCVAALKSALQKGRPEIFNTDQGSQFTSAGFTGVLLSANVRISMDGRGRCFDNIFTERLWRTVKYEDVYIRGYEDFDEAEEGLDSYFKKYNSRRVHQSLGYRTPDEVHAEGLAKIEVKK